jgi:tripartite-type tricarboxylate transporter receptor subunit TctC
MKAVYGLIAAFFVILAGCAASAQANYPDKPIRIIVGFLAGVAPDVTSRLLGDKFNESWAKGVVVENVTGAGGNLAVERVAKAAPDGYTLLMGAKVHQQAVANTAMPDVREKLDALGLDITGDGPEAVAAIIKADTAKWAKVIRDATIKPGE